MIKYAFILSITISIPASIMTQIDTDGYTTLLSNILTTVWLFIANFIMFNRIVKKKSVHLVGAILLATYILETITNLSSFFIYNLLDTSKIYFVITYIITYYIPVPILFILFLHFLKKINFIILFNQFFKTRKLKIIFTIFLVFIANLPNIYYEILPANFIEIPYIFPIIHSSIIFSLIFYSAFHLLSQEKIESQKKLMMEQENYFNSLIDIQKEMKIFQHDYKNVIAGLYLYAQKGDMEQINQYLNESFINLDRKLIDRLNITANLSTIQILEIKNIIMSKLDLIEAKNIFLNLKINGTIKNNNFDITNFINNTEALLDDAIDYAKTNETIEMKLNDSGKSLITTITNKSYISSYEYNYN